MKKTVKRNVFGIITLVVVIALIWSLVSFINTFINYPELIKTTDRYHLMIALNDGNKDAETYYMTKYILNDKYLYDGPVTLKLVAQKYNVDQEELTKLWEDGEYTSMDNFVKKVVKPMVKDAEYRYITR